MSVDLSGASVEAIAQRVAELLEPAADRPGELIDAAEAARRLGVTRDWVYRHAAELGAVRIGEGTRGRLRFDPGQITRPTPPAPVSAPAKRRPRRRQRPTGDLLPIYGRDYR